MRNFGDEVAKPAKDEETRKVLARDANVKRAGHASRNRVRDQRLVRKKKRKARRKKEVLYSRSKNEHWTGAKGCATVCGN